MARSWRWVAMATLIGGAGAQAAPPMMWVDVRITQMIGPSGGVCHAFSFGSECTISSDGSFSGDLCLDQPTIFEPIDWNSSIMEVRLSEAGVERWWQCVAANVPCEGGWIDYERYMFGKLRSIVPFWVEPFSQGDWTRPLTEVDITCSNRLGPRRFTFCRDDVDASGQIDFGDLSYVLMMIGGDTWGGRFDLDDSGEIDLGDIAMVLLSFGPCETG